MWVGVGGARGSTPAPGADFARYGGHTSCLAVGSGPGPPMLLLDAGTGMRRVTPWLGGAPFRGAILLTHLHWDHVQGLPFFGPGDHPDADVFLGLPAQGVDAEALLGRAMGPPFFPIGPAGLRGRWRFGELAEGVFPVAGFEVLTREIPHKGGRTFGFRVSDGRRSLAYVPDHHPATLGAGPTGTGAEHAAVRELADGVDLLVHDAQLTRAEFADRGHLGHATIDYALALARTCGVGRLLAFHHDPTRTDEELDVLSAGVCGHDPPVTFAVEGQRIDLGGSS